MIITCKKKIPSHWIIFAMMPWAAFNLQAQIMGTAFIFSLKKFLDNPAGLTFILSLPSFFGMVATPLSAILSDRIWTRWGRRKPFVVVSWTGQILALVCMPLAPNLWLLVAANLAFGIFGNICAPLEPLKQEIVPPQERGRGSATMQWYVQFTTLFFYFIAIGRFDDKKFMAGFPITGEMVMYWMAALILVIMLLMVTLGIKETHPQTSPPSDRFRLGSFFGSLLDRELWPIYFLCIGGAVFNASMGALGNLLYTEQWGYTKQEFGTNVAIGGVINLCLIGVMGVIADRWNRLRAYQILLSIALGIKLIYYCYITYILPDQRPSLPEMVVLGETMSITSILLAVVAAPLAYDYVIRDKMGTMVAGVSIINNLTNIITLNGVGLFMWAYTAFLQPPAGEMTRVVLRNEVRKEDVRSMILKTKWTLPQDGAVVPSSKIHINAWYGNGLVSTTGQAWEIRLPDPSSEKLEKTKEDLEQEHSVLAGKIMLLKRNAYPKSSELAETEAKSVRLRQVDAEIASIKQELQERADKFRQQVNQTFGEQVLPDGDQIIAAETRPALVLEFPVNNRPDSRKVEKLLDALRQENPTVLDLRPIKMEQGFGLALSGLQDQGGDEAALAASLVASLDKTASKYYPHLLLDAGPPKSHRETAVILKLHTVEDPVELPVSPINRVVNAILGLFTDPAPPDHLVAASARSLRSPGEIDHVRITSGPGKSIEVAALLSPSFPNYAGEPDDLQRKIQSLLGPSAAPEFASRIRNLYDRASEAACEQRITVPRPFLKFSYVPMRYDYMCGYIWTFFMGLIGLWITFLFARRERKGLIRKLGIEEAALA